MHVTFAEGVLIILAVGQLIYAALTFHKDRAAAEAENRIQKRPIFIIASMMLLTWAAVAFDIYSRPSLPAAFFINYGVTGPKEFMGIVLLNNWQDYSSKKAVLITRTIYANRDRLEDDWIAKSIPYTIEGPVVSMSITEGQMRFSPGLVNYVEYNFALLPPNISVNQIRTLGDVARLGGKVLATNAQGFPVPNVEPAPNVQPATPNVQLVPKVQPLPTSQEKKPSK